MVLLVKFIHLFILEILYFYMQSVQTVMMSVENAGLSQA